MESFKVLRVLLETFVQIIVCARPYDIQTLSLYYTEYIIQNVFESLIMIGRAAIDGGQNVTQ